MNQQQTLAGKLLTIQKRIGAVTKGASNPHFRSKYADLNEVLDVAKSALNEEGIFISQAPGADGSGKYLETSLINAADGQQISGRVYFSGSEDNMQKIGAAITYARRFGLVSLLALESEDDDGETAVGRGGVHKGEARSEKSSNSNGAAKPVASNAPKAAPVQAESKTSRKTLLEKISLTSKVIIDSKRASQEDVVKMLAMYQVKSKEELTDDQAAKLLTQLEGKLK